MLRPRNEYRGNRNLCESPSIGGGIVPHFLVRGCVDSVSMEDFTVWLGGRIRDILQTAVSDGWLTTVRGCDCVGTTTCARVASSSAHPVIISSTRPQTRSSPCASSRSSICSQQFACFGGHVRPADAKGDRVDRRCRAASLTSRA